MQHWCIPQQKSAYLLTMLINLTSTKPSHPLPPTYTSFALHSSTSLFSLISTNMKVLCSQEEHFHAVTCTHCLSFPVTSTVSFKAIVQTSLNQGKGSVGLGYSLRRRKTQNFSSSTDFTGAPELIKHWNRESCFFSCFFFHMIIQYFFFSCFVAFVYV